MRQKRHNPFVMRCTMLFLIAALTLTSALALTKAPEPGTGTAHGVDLQLVDSFPANGDTEVGFMPTIYCKFNHNVCDSNICTGNLACLSMWAEDGSSVEISTYVIDPQVDFLMRQFLILEPVKPLAPNTTYEVRLVPGIQARNGMVTGQNFSFYFTTGAEDRLMGDPFEGSSSEPGNQPPQEVAVEVTETFPVANAKNVRLQSSIEFRFNSNVTVGELAEGNLTLLSLTDEYEVPVEVNTYVEDPKSDLAQRQILHMKPVSPLLPSTTYVAKVAAGVLANNGSSSSQAYEIIFTTTDKPLSEETVIDPNAPRPTPKPVPEAKPRQTEQPASTTIPEESELPTATEMPVATDTPTPEPAETARPAESTAPEVKSEQNSVQNSFPVLILVVAFLGVVVVVVLLIRKNRKK